MSNLKNEKNRSGVSILTVTVIIFIAGITLAMVYILSLNNGSDKDSGSPENLTENNQSENFLDEGQSELKNNQEGMIPEETESAEGTYIDYGSASLDSIKTEKIVMFFHASWCPTCKALEDNIKKNKIPDGLTILKVNYDAENSLRQKYKVTIQHTLAQVDNEGNLLKKWTGSMDIQDITKQLI